MPKTPWVPVGGEARRIPQREQAQHAHSNDHAAHDGEKREEVQRVNDNARHNGPENGGEHRHHGQRAAHLAAVARAGDIGRPGVERAVIAQLITASASTTQVAASHSGSFGRNSVTPKPMVNTPHRMYPNAMNGRRLPSLSLAVPMRNVQKVDTTAETPTIQATMHGSGAIFRYTKVLNQEFSMFQQICPAIPSTQMSAQFLRDIFSMRLPRFPQTARPQAARRPKYFSFCLYCIMGRSALKEKTRGYLQFSFRRPIITLSQSRSLRVGLQKGPQCRSDGELRNGRKAPLAVQASHPAAA